MDIPALLLAVLLGQAPTGPATGEARVEHCLVSLIEDIEVSAQEAGAIVEVGVAEGDRVVQGDLLARIDDERAQLHKFASERELKAALARAGDNIEVRYAEASLDVADAELQENVDINRRAPGSVPSSELRRLKLTKHRSVLQIDRSRLDMKVAQMTAEIKEAEVKTAEANIRRRRLVSPIDGMVIGVLRQESEWVDAGQAVVRIVRMDRLRVEGFLDASHFNPDEVAGRPVVVEVQRARGRRVQFSGRVVFVSPLVQAGNKYRVRAEVENRQESGHWLLRPGMNAEMRIGL